MDLSMTAEGLLSTLERDGFVVVRSFLDEEVVARARRDLEALYAQDLEERCRRNADEPLFTHGSTKSVLTQPSHLLLGLPGRSAALDECYEKIFSAALTKALLRGMAGEHFKLRDVNCRYMTGAHDEGDFLNPPHEWHRDSPGEFCVAIFLNEVAPGDNAATALVPGSHRFPWCPRWNALFGEPFYVDRDGRRGLRWLTRWNPFNRLLYRRRMGQQTGAFGKPGDFYIFLNDTWHGRMANRHGGRAMIAMAGGFPTDFPFPDEPAPFDAGALARLPPNFQRAAARGAPVNREKNTIIQRMVSARRRDTPAQVFWWARQERALVMRLSDAIERPPPAFRALGRLVPRLRQAAYRLARRA
jgi:hypothetical protein